MRKGELVCLTCEGRSVPAEIVLISPNGKSLILVFDAMLDGHVGTMPIFLDDDGTYRALMTGTPLRIDMIQ
jgi:hypothetical protein